MTINRWESLLFLNMTFHLHTTCRHTISTIVYPTTTTTTIFVRFISFVVAVAASSFSSECLNGNFSLKLMKFLFEQMFSNFCSDKNVTHRNFFVYFLLRSHSLCVRVCQLSFSRSKDKQMAFFCFGIDVETCFTCFTLLLLALCFYFVLFDFVT